LATTANTTTEAPYLGPRPFERDDRSVFFGRNAEVRELLSLVVAHRVVLLYAASGAGKTSLLNAGLIPLLEAESFELLPPARLRGVLPANGSRTSAENIYTTAVISGWGSDIEGIAYELKEPGAFAAVLAARPHQTAADGYPAPRVVIFDQFEELFSLYPERWRDRRRFLAEISAALEQDPLLRVIFAIREEYIAHLDSYASILPGELRHRFRLERLGAEAALTAITRPIEPTGRQFAAGVAERLVTDLRTFEAYTDSGERLHVEGQFVEPVHLQVVCQSLWSELPSDVTVINEDHLRTFGDVDDVLVRFYDDAVAGSVTAAGLKEARLRRLLEAAFITPGGTRGTAYRGATSTAGVPNRAIDELEDRHLIRAEWRSGARWYELTHDRLVVPVQTSNGVYGAASARRRMRRLATGAALVLVAGGTAVGLALGFSASDSSSNRSACRSCVAQFTGVSLDQDVTLLRYLVRDRRPLTRYTAAQLHQPGVLVNYVLQLRKAKGRVVQVTWRMLNASTNDEVAQGTSMTVRATAELMRLRLSLWTPTPRSRGRYVLVLQASGVNSPIALDTIRTPEFIGLRGAGLTTRVELRVIRMGAGHGVVTSERILCGSRCTAVYDFGTQVTLRATPSPGSTFIGWRGACSQGPVCTVVVGPVTLIAARFESVPG
jgi:hypothetical protein